MSDRELQAAERRWRETGDVAALGELLRLQRRAGAHPFPRLELAAWLGHPGARAALGDEAPVGRHAPIEAWAEELEDRGVAAILAGWRESDERLAPALQPIERLLTSGEHPGYDYVYESPRSVALRLLYDLAPAIERVCREAQDRGGLRPATILAALAHLQELQTREPGSQLSRPFLEWCAGSWSGAPVATSLADEVRWLVARRARGQVSPERVLIAALAGDPVAVEVAPDEELDRPGAWVARLVHLDPVAPPWACVQVACALRGLVQRAGLAGELDAVQRRFDLEPRGGAAAIRSLLPRLDAALAPGAAPDHLPVTPEVRAGVVACRDLLAAALDPGTARRALTGALGQVPGGWDLLRAGLIRRSLRPDRPPWTHKER